ncbi:uncharacterized protein LOC18429058 [Amborella trichopoda]|nr:uncharacterized protein LOC18429058 [Amborella trichopoda]|eukprot:XP_006838414.2 uncharacterized protein LOC18429058 [Amborella trichopoda]
MANMDNLLCIYALTTQRPSTCFWTLYFSKLSLSLSKTHFSTLSPMISCLGSATMGICRPLNSNNYLLQACPSLQFSKPKSLQVVGAKRASSRTSRLDRVKKPNTTTTTKEEEEPLISPENEVADATSDVDDGYFLPELPGDKPDFWEGPQWDWLGFFVQYMWAFGGVFALIACGVAVATYNEGATDFKQTPVYKESVQSRGLFEEPGASDSEVFEANPTEEAPSLE